VWGLAVVAVLVVVLAVVVLVTPWRLALRLGTDPGGIDLRLAPFGGALGEFRLPRQKPHKAPRHVAPLVRPESAVRRRRLILQALPQFLFDVVRQARLERLRVALRFGTGDPALTGQIYGQLMPLVHGGLLPRTADVALSPVFDAACLSGDAEVLLRATPLRLALPLLRLARAGGVRP